MVYPLGSKEGACLLADKLIECLNAPIKNGKHNVSVSASIGIAYASGGDASEKDVFQAADQSMYVSKKKGGSSYTVSDV